MREAVRRPSGHTACGILKPESFQNPFRNPLYNLPRAPRIPPGRPPNCVIAAPSCDQRSARTAGHGIRFWVSFWTPFLYPSSRSWGGPGSLPTAPSPNLSGFSSQNGGHFGFQNGVRKRSSTDSNIKTLKTLKPLLLYCLKTSGQLCKTLFSVLKSIKN